MHPNCNTGFGSWAYNEIGHLGDIFLRQVVTPSNNDISAIAACLDLLVPHFQKVGHTCPRFLLFFPVQCMHTCIVCSRELQLRELGMDLEFLFWQLIEPGLQDTLEKVFSSCITQSTHLTPWHVPCRRDGSGLASLHMRLWRSTGSQSTLQDDSSGSRTSTP